MRYDVDGKIFARLSRTVMLCMLLVTLALVSSSYAAVPQRTVRDGETYHMHVGDMVTFYNRREPHFSSMARNLYAYNWFTSKGSEDFADFNRIRNANSLMVTAKKTGTFTITAFLRYTVPGTWKGYEYNDTFTVVISD